VLLDRPLAQLCSKARLLDLIRQLHHLRRGPEEGAAAAPVSSASRLRRSACAQARGGVIWHTQGSGKSILMVLIAKWLLEHDPDARVLVITDRDELDKQIEGVMQKRRRRSARMLRRPGSPSRAEFVAEAGRASAAPAVRTRSTSSIRPT
jgi:type I restriction enzyme R subunit